MAGEFGEHIDKWTGRAANLLTFWPLVFPTGVALISGYLSTGVVWLASLGPFGWFTSGLCGFFLTSASLALLGKARLYRSESKSRERISGDSSRFDPMARVYENKRLYLRDLAPLGRRTVVNKKFIGCEIIGPGTIVLGLRSSIDRPIPELKDCNTFDVDAVEIENSRNSNLAVEFMDCDFDGCKFYHLTTLFTERSNENLTWITKPNAPHLLEDHASE